MLFTFITFGISFFLKKKQTNKIKNAEQFETKKKIIKRVTNSEEVPWHISTKQNNSNHCSTQMLNFQRWFFFKFFFFLELMLLRLINFCLLWLILQCFPIWSPYFCEKKKKLLFFIKILKFPNPFFFFFFSLWNFQSVFLRWHFVL